MGHTDPAEVPSPVGTPRESTAPAVEVETLVEWAARRQRIWGLARTDGAKVRVALNTFGPAELKFAQRYAVHQDAVCVMLAVNTLAQTDPAAARLIVTCAEQGDRPPFQPSGALAGRWAEVKGPAANASAVRNEFGNARLGYVPWVRADAPFTPVEWIDGEILRARWRAAYSRWRAGLDIVYAHLLDLHMDGLMAREPMPAAAPRWPWLH